MNILIACNTLTYCSGSPMYNYTLAMEMAKQGHNVTLLSRFNNWNIVDESRDIMRKNLSDIGVLCLDFLSEKSWIDVLGKFDYAIISQGGEFEHLFKDANCGKIINVVHSEYEVEVPMKVADAWVAIRPSIKEHLIENYKIPKDDIHVIYNPIDRERFSSKKYKVYDMPYRRILIPCTLDPLREKFLNYMIDRANSHFRVEIYGKPCGANLHRSRYATFHDPVFNIEDVMADNFDYVAGILLGRVNLEANSMGIPSWIHNPDNPEEWELFQLSDSLFDKRHNVKNVVKQLLSL